MVGNCGGLTLYTYKTLITMVGNCSGITSYVCVKHLPPWWVTVVVSLYTCVKHLPSWWVTVVVSLHTCIKHLPPWWVTAMVSLYTCVKQHLPPWFKTLTIMVRAGKGGGNCSISDTINTLGGGPAVFKTKEVVSSKICHIHSPYLWKNGVVPDSASRKHLPTWW